MTTKVTFKLPAEFVDNASEGILLGEFNNWNHAEAVQLEKKEDGSMYAEIALTAGKSYQYRYLLNDGRWVNDNSSTTHTEVYGSTVQNCIIEVPAVEKKKVAPKKVAVSKPAVSLTKAPAEVVAKKVTAKKAAVPKKVATPKKVSAPKVK